MKDFALSTSDNPYNPIKNFDEWWAFDNSKGHCTCQFLDRLAPISDNLSDSINNQILEDTIDEIVRINILGFITNGEINYIKIVEEDDDKYVIIGPNNESL